MAIVCSAMKYLTICSSAYEDKHHVRQCCHRGSWSRGTLWGTTIRMLQNHKEAVGLQFSVLGIPQGARYLECAMQHIDPRMSHEKRCPTCSHIVCFQFFFGYCLWLASFSCRKGSVTDMLTLLS